jgi:hypothetical protein
MVLLRCSLVRGFGAKELRETRERLKAKDECQLKLSFAYVQNKSWPDRKSCFVGGYPFLEKKYNPIL